MVSFNSAACASNSARDVSRRAISCSSSPWWVRLGLLLQQRLVQPGQFFCHICLTDGKLFPGGVQSGRIDIICHGPDQLFFPLFQGGPLPFRQPCWHLVFSAAPSPMRFDLLQRRLGRGVTGQLGGGGVMEGAAYRAGLAFCSDCANRPACSSKKARFFRRYVSPNCSDRSLACS